MAFFVLFALLAFCSGQSVSPTTSPSPSITPCSAQPGFFCNGGSALICPIGAYCAGGSALNVSCYPVTACTVAGLSAQPPCYWNVSTLAGSGTPGFAEGVGHFASFNRPDRIVVDDNGRYVIGDAQNHRIRLVTASGNVSTLAGSGSQASIDGQGVLASFSSPYGVARYNGSIAVTDFSGNRIRVISLSGYVSTLAGTGGAGSSNGPLLSSTFNAPTALAADSFYNLYVVDKLNHKVRLVNITSRLVSTVVGTGSATWADGIGTSASINQPNDILIVNDTFWILTGMAENRLRSVSLPLYAVNTLAGSGAATVIDGVGTNAAFFNPAAAVLSPVGIVYVSDYRGNRIRSMVLVSRAVTTLAGSGVASSTGGYALAATFKFPHGIAITVSGVLVVGDETTSTIRQLSCVPCPASYFCISGAPVLCPAGFYCPLSSINATLCPKGFFSNAGASNCTSCPAGTFASTTGSTSCKQCPGGHYCPARASSWARLNCGLGNYCPDGSGAPTPCPYQVPPPGGWGALQVQGPAFLVETAHCLNHCFWNFTSGDGMLSKC